MKAGIDIILLDLFDASILYDVSGPCIILLFHWVSEWLSGKLIEWKWSINYQKQSGTTCCTMCERMSSMLFLLTWCSNQQGWKITNNTSHISQGFAQRCVQHLAERKHQDFVPIKGTVPYHSVDNVLASCRPLESTSPGCLHGSVFLKHCWSITWRMSSWIMERLEFWQFFGWRMKILWAQHIYFDFGYVNFCTWKWSSNEYHFHRDEWREKKACRCSSSSFRK